MPERNGQTFLVSLVEPVAYLKSELPILAVKLRRSSRGYRADFCGLFCHPRVQKTYGRIAQKFSLFVVLARSKGAVGGTTEETGPTSGSVGILSLRESVSSELLPSLGRQCFYDGDVLQ